MISQEENYFCFNLSTRRAAGLVGLTTFLCSIGLIAKAGHDFAGFQTDEGSLCSLIKSHLKSSCHQILKTAWVISLMALIDSTMVFFSSGFLLCGVVKEVAWLMVPYMMWIKMTLSIHAVLCIFLAMTYKVEEIGYTFLFNVSLIVIHGFCAYVVRHYDDMLMKKIFSHSEGVLS